MVERFTDDPLDFVVHDDAEAMAELFALPVAERFDALARMRGLAKDDQAGRAFLRRIHEQGDGFRVGVDDPRFPAALRRLVDSDAWGQVRRELERAWARLRAAVPGIRHPGKVDVVLTLGNPDDTLFVERTLGYYGMGAVPGSIWLVAWPTEYNVSRIGACAVHELVHNIRTSNVRGQFSLAEWIVQEGVAEAFTIEACGPDSTGGWYAGVTGDALEDAWTKVTSAFGTGSFFGDWTPYVFGDESASRQGARPAGLPHMAGYAVGRAIVERYLAARVLSAAEAVPRSTAEILQGAGLGD